MTKGKLKFARLGVCFGLLALVCLSACVATDRRKPFTRLRASIRRTENDAVAQAKFLAFIPLGTPRTEVYTFLRNNFKGSANIRLDDPPPCFEHAEAASMISVDLWTRYAAFGVQYDTAASFYFNKEKKLDHLVVSTADSCF